MRANAYRIYSYHGTVLFYDPATSRLCHGPLKHAPDNLRLHVLGGKSWLTWQDHNNERLSVLNIEGTEGYVKALERGSEITITNDLASPEIFYLKFNEYYFSSEPDGHVKPQVKWEKEWERYYLEPDNVAYDTSDSLFDSFGRIKSAIAQITDLNNVGALESALLRVQQELKDCDILKAATSDSARLLQAALGSASQSSFPDQAAPQREPKSQIFSSVSSFLQTDVPVFVPCFNNPTYVASMIKQLLSSGFRKITLIDGGSTFLPMVQLLNNVPSNINIVYARSNPGPHWLINNLSSYSLLPRHFCLTDPDLEFNKKMPDTFVGDLAALAAREKIGKAGFALELSDKAEMKLDKFKQGEGYWNIWDWESRFWRDEIKPLHHGGDSVYRAHIDTTFALYDREFFKHDDFYAALRVAGKFTCRHLPWYRDSIIPDDEVRFYAGLQKHSSYAIPSS